MLEGWFVEFIFLILRPEFWGKFFEGAIQESFEDLRSSIKWISPPV